MPVKIKANNETDFSLILNVGFIKLKLYPSAEKKPKKKKKKSAKPKKKAQKTEDKKAQKQKNTKNKHDLDWLLTTLGKIKKLSEDVLKDFFGHIIIKKFMLSVNVAGQDAADTAIRYGELCAIVYPATAVITRNIHCKKFGVDVTPNFNENAKSTYWLDFELKTSIFWLIALVLKNGLGALRLINDFR